MTPLTTPTITSAGTSSHTQSQAGQRLRDTNQIRSHRVSKGSVKVDKSTKSETDQTKIARCSPSKETALSLQWRKMTRSSAAVVVVVPAAVSQISTDWSAKITRSHAGHCSAVGSSNDNTFQRVSPASASPG